ncbi:DUF4783 domain-containing protein [Pedobacter gandavensis]|uniref:DUF4783 domain-containing protein n=1 Tax=Pedobacter gandavensis TaxID=2679963 RepID=A0ABR6F027_9SPHI|nr:DUF4783 domain-containing protein [Pedobacter gandavensis]MBB2150893.1 DUF4783 domain-containing protein [Pedobacter gandavensis]
MKPLLFFTILFTSFSSAIAIQSDIIDNLSGYFKAGNAKDVAQNFSSSVELIIIDEEDVYSKAQAEQILRNFFTKYPPVKSSVTHTINANPNFRFGILSLQTKNGKFRVSITMKKSNNAFFITELRIEPDK